MKSNLLLLSQIFETFLASPLGTCQFAKVEKITKQDN